jgi:hypothetical protein
MRKDMSKVVSEHPRVGGTGTKFPKGYKKKLNRALRECFDDLKKHESMARYRNFGYDAKERAINLKPIRRFLDTKVGCSWNEIWAEMCSLDNNSKAYLEYEVDKNVHMIDGVPHDYLVYVTGFYVNPETELLSKAEHKSHKRVKSRNVNIAWKKNDHGIYNNIKGIWYKIVFETFPIEKEIPDWHVSNGVPAVYDILLGWTTKRICLLHYGAPIYAKIKKQLNSKEIKKLQLIPTEI